MTNHFKQRLVVGSLSVALLFVVIYFSYSPFFKPFFVLFTTGIISLALIEYYQLARHKGFRPLMIPSLVCTFIYIIAVYMSLHIPHLAFLPSLTLFCFFLLFFLFFFKAEANPLINLAITVFGLAYLLLPLSCIIKINYFFMPHNEQDGRLWLAYVFAITKITDIGGYVFGKTLGRYKLLPHISPKKTIEGAVGGLLMAVMTSILFHLYSSYASPLFPFVLTLWQSIWLGLLLSLVAQFGDLAESLLKRDAGVKDSSNLPGLGGVLDIVDSLVFTLPLMYFVLKLGLVG